jgi:hypothetical protein
MSAIDLADSHIIHMDEVWKINGGRFYTVKASAHRKACALSFLFDWNVKVFRTDKGWCVGRLVGRLSSSSQSFWCNSEHTQCAKLLSGVNQFYGGGR